MGRHLFVPTSHLSPALRELHVAKLRSVEQLDPELQAPSQFELRSDHVLEGVGLKLHKPVSVAPDFEPEPV